ncbi:MAG: BamA/OMP85 family outer membrane protein [Ilyomonas sp.]
MAKLNQYKGWLLCIMLLSFFCSKADAQKKISLYIDPVDMPAGFISNLNIDTVFSSRLLAIQYVQQLPSLLASKGYIAASVDSVKEDSSSISIKLYAGEKYRWKELIIDEELWPVLNQLGYYSQSFNNRFFDPAKVSHIYDQLLNYYANNGYPFATVRLDNFYIENASVSAKLDVEKGALYRIDSIHLNGNVKLSQHFLHQYLDIQSHELYNLQKLDKINQRIAELPFAEQSQPWDVTMLNTGAILNIYLQPKQSNQINVLIGFLPANQQLGGKLLLTGQANLNLKNAFGTGETIGLDWQQLQSKSPRLNLLFQKPYLFNTSVGLNFNFELYKRDTSFLNINGLFGLQYALSSKETGKLLLQTSRTNVLNIDTLQVMFTKKLPDVIDVSSVSIGLEYDYFNTNYRFNPRSGNEFVITGTAGNKIIRKNNAILQLKDASFDYNKLYDSLKLKSYQLRIQANASHYFPVGKQATFKTALQLGLYQSPSYFNNELFQMGGYRLLRGFDEESIYTNRFAVATIEYRYLLARNSYFFGFTDIGWAKYQSNSLSFSHTYAGVGAGLAFETNTGIFNITYAVGKRDDTKFDLRQSKIHLGFISVF